MRITNNQSSKDFAPKVNQKAMSKSTTIPIWSNRTRLEIIEKFFGYANEYLDAFSKEESYDNACRFLEHFLLFLTSAAQNLIDASFTYKPMESVSEKPKKINLLTSPTFDTLTQVPDMRSVIWAWEARNTLAHNYISLSSNSAELYINESPFSLSCGSTLEINGFFLKEIFDVRGNCIKPPRGETVVELRESLNFWRFTCQYILGNQGLTERVRYMELWSEFNKNKSNQVNSTIM